VSVPVAIWSGTFNVWGVELRCHVLDDGQRVIEAESMERFVAAMQNGALDQTQELTEFYRWQRGD
jgi:hypothetical protein